jgi:hypothetical protein
MGILLNFSYQQTKRVPVGKFLQEAVSGFSVVQKIPAKTGGIQ